MKSDNEPSIVKLLKESLAVLKVSGLEQVTEEHPPPYDSQANGLAEAGVKQIKTKLRTINFAWNDALARGFRHDIPSLPGWSNMSGS